MNSGDTERKMNTRVFFEHPSMGEQVNSTNKGGLNGVRGKQAQSHGQFPNHFSL